MTTKILVRVILGLQVLQIVGKIVEISLDQKQRENDLQKQLSDIQERVGLL